MLGSPVPTFETGFKDASAATLRAFLKTNIVENGDMPGIGGELSTYSFIVLDIRSTEDGTCEVHYLWDHMPDREALEYVESEARHEWKVWRVKFRVAWPMLAGLWHAPEDMLDQFEDGVRAYVDENGVAQLPGIEQNEYEFPEFENRAPLGKGKVA